MNEQNGACGCGAVEFTLNSKFLNVVNCHCNMCRVHNGSSFSTYAVFPFSYLEITKGNELVKTSIAGRAKKHFCEKCGSPLYNVNDKYPGVCMVFLGTLDSSRILAPKINIWCDSKLAWVDNLSSISSLPQGIKPRGA